jgi:molybdate transport system substrate-binding protein
MEMEREEMLRRTLLAAGWVLVLLFGNSGTIGAAEPNSVVIFAAASTTNAITEIGNLFEARKMGKVTHSFASSSTLAKQIENGAPANLFISADKKWMDYLEERKLIIPSTRFDLLGNRLMLIAPSDSRATIEIRPNFDLAGLLGDGYLAMGDPSHVPAGIYGKEALVKLGVWDQVKDEVARAKDVRAALALVERGEAVLGVVYATDAAITKKVRVVAEFPRGSHPPIVYPAAIVAGNETPVAKRFLDFLKTPPARTVFEKYGFEVR